MAEAFDENANFLGQLNIRQNGTDNVGNDLYQTLKFGINRGLNSMMYSDMALVSPTVWAGVAECCMACYQVCPQSCIPPKSLATPTFQWTFGFRRSLWNCKIPPVDHQWPSIKPAELAKLISDAAPSRLQLFCTRFKVLPTWCFQFRCWPELEPDSPYSVSLHLQTSLSPNYIDFHIQP